MATKKTIIDIETNQKWSIERRTRGVDIVSVADSKVTQTWILILTNREGHRRFVPEARVWESYRPVDTVAAPSP